jgi:hypothetical protein
MTTTILNAGDPVPPDQSTTSSDPLAPAPKAGEAEPAWKSLGYTSEAEMVKGHKELRAKMSAEGAPKASDPAGSPAKAPATDAAAAAAKAGLDLTALGAEYIANGNALKAETYAKFEQGGISKEAVDGYIAGQQAIAAQQTAEFAAHVGGPEALTKITSWANTALGPEDHEAFNKVLDTGNKAAIKLALDGLKAKYESANGSDDPTRLGGEQGARAGTDIFESWAQLVAAQNDPRYATDEAYRDKVMAKLARSPL